MDSYYDGPLSEYAQGQGYARGPKQTASSRAETRDRRGRMSTEYDTRELSTGYYATIRHGTWSGYMVTVYCGAIMFLPSRWALTLPAARRLARRMIDDRRRRDERKAWRETVREKGHD